MNVKSNKNRVTVPAADLEPGAGDAPLGTEAVKRLDSPCRIHIHSRRHRLADADGVCAKYVIDGLIHAGLLRDDSPRWVRQVSFSQEQIPQREDETTLVTIEIE